VKTSSTLRLDTTNLSIGFATDDRGGEGGKEETFGGSSGSETGLTLIDNETRINLLYKNLEHVSHAYFTAEGIFPYWETVFALIVGQLFIAYFQGIFPSQEILLIVFGIVLSFIWFILVSLNLQNVSYMGSQAE